MIWPQVGLFLLPQIGFEIRQQRYSLIDGYLVASLVPTSSWPLLTHHLQGMRIVSLGSFHILIRFLIESL